jgi:hypothetical protein
MITFAGVHQSFRNGCSLLKELAGWTTCHEIIRRACYHQADLLAVQRRDASPEVDPFRLARGLMEFQTDATKVNTLGGWRDMKIALFCKRLAGASAAAEQWDQRRLVKPTARFAFAAIEGIESFSPRWRPWAERLGLGDERLSVLGDGAEWIWLHAEAAFANWRGVLDIYHSSEWLSKAAKAGCGEGTGEASRWLREARLALLKDGYAGLCEYFARSAGWVPNRRGLEESAAEVLNYFCGHQGRLNYALRLRQGLPIGSGQIEGACKQMIGRRMKQTGAQWGVANANRMALLCSLGYTDALPAYFNAA